MTHSQNDQVQAFRELHCSGPPLLLPNAWDAGSARLIESCGAVAIATTSGGLAWSHGYPDGDALPTPILASALAEIARVIRVPLTVEIEGGYSADPGRVGDTVAAVIDAGAVGINIEDGNAPPELLMTKIAAAKRVAERAGVALFVNARTDVYLHKLVPLTEALAVTLQRAHQYREAGCDGLFVPGVLDAREIRAIAEATDLPLNVMVLKKLPAVAELANLGVRRISAATWVAKAALTATRRAALEFLTQGRYAAMLEATVTYDEMNALFSASRDEM